MANTFTAAFAQTPKTASAVVTGAAGTITGDSPTNTVLLVTAGANGAILTRLWAMPRSTVTASSLVIWISNDAGTTQRMKDSVLMPAQTVATTTAITYTQFTNYTETTPLRLAAGDRVYVGSQVALANGIVFSAEYSDY
jgi:hypothetical protein